MRAALSILAPLGWLYARGASLRRQAYARGLLRRHHLNSPVISVGGLSVGGSMKTPVVVELARALSARGPKVGVLGHGYRGSDHGSLVVSDGSALLESSYRAGDEAVLIAHELPGSPVVVGEDKAAAGTLLEERFGKRIVLVDSGFQHLRLFRDLDIVCVSEGDLGARVLPSGRLRESPRALEFADLVFTDRASDGPRVARLKAARPGDVFAIARTDFGFFPADGAGGEVKAPTHAYVFCGIGHPQRLVSDTAAQGVSISGQRFFRDHHRYGPMDLGEVAAAASQAGALAAVTTAKDAVRIHGWPGPLPLLVLSARLEIEGLPAVLKRIDRVILARIKAGR